MSSPAFSSAHLVVYDLDGTLVNAFGDIAAAANHALKSMKYKELSTDQVTSYVGHGVHSLMQHCLGGEPDEAEVEEAVKLFGAYAREHPADHAHIYDGCHEVLQALHLRGTKQVVVSNKPDALTRKVAEILGLSEICEEIIGESPRFPRKPDPAVVADVLKRYETASPDAVMVGDGDTDMQVGKALGIGTVGVAWGIHSREQLLGWGADIVAETPAELKTILTGDGH